MKSASPDARTYELSHAQRRLWVLAQMEGGLAAYNMARAAIIEGALNTTALRASFDALSLRHESLRTSFAQHNSEPVQIIHPGACVYFNEVDFSGQADAEAAATEAAAREAQHAVHLAAEPLLRVNLFKLADNKHLLQVNVHHIVSDEWSLGILFRDLLALYNSASTQTAIELPALKIQYKDYAAWQNRRMARLVEERAYWHRKLAGKPPALNLPADFPRPPVKSHDGRVEGFELSAATAASLRQLARRKNTTIFSVLLALVKTLIFRYTGEVDVLVGTPIAGRAHPDLEDQIGLFLNMLPLRSQIDPAAPFEALVESAAKTLVEAFDHQGYPFEKMVEELVTERDMSRSPLLDVVIVYWQRDAQNSAGATDSLKITPVELPAATSKFDITIKFIEEGASLFCYIEYCTALFSQARIQRMCGHIGRLAESIEANSSTPICNLDLLTTRESFHLLEEFNRTDASYPTAATIHCLFEEQATRTPDNTAVIYDDTSLSYAQLDRRANSLARHLHDVCGVRTGDLVAILAPKTEQTIVATLGVLKAGAAYVPIDPFYPASRIRFMLDDSACRTVIGDGNPATQHDLPASVEFTVDVRAISDAAGPRVHAPVQPDDTAYVIYTSGSTGNPKGCLVTHRNVVRLMKNDKHPFSFRADDAWVMAHSHCFDFSVWEMYGALLYGGRVVVAARETVRDAAAFLTLIRAHRITVLNQTPAAFYNLIEAERSATAHDLNTHLRYIIFGGDKLEPAYLRAWSARYPPSQIRLVNMYGITETTVHVTYHELTERDFNSNAGRSPIGVPIPETHCYVLDSWMNPMPIGIPGEIFVGGSGVSQGYLNRPELNDARFVSNPFKPGERMYRSGDLGYWKEDGTLEYLGRNDDQVQIRGYRVELGEIASRLLAFPLIDKAVVIARDNGQNVQELIAYVVAPRLGSGHPHAGLDSAALRKHLAETLPDYMVPAQFVRVEAIPLTSNGKVDQRALPEPERFAMETGAEYRAPRNTLETQLAQIWGRILGRERVGIQDNYFSLGGDSIKIIRLVSAIQKELGIRVEIRDIFRFPSIAELSPLMRRTGEAASPLAKALSELDDFKKKVLDDPEQRRKLPPDFEDFYPMSDIEQGMIYHGLLGGDSGVYHDQFVYQFQEAGFKPELFFRALPMSVAAHDILRTSFHLSGFEQPIQIVHRNARADFASEELCLIPESKQKQYLTDILARDRKQPFDVTRPGLFRMRIFRLQQNTYCLFWIFHHAILDGWSNASLMTEVTANYLRLKNEQNATVTPLAAKYRHFVADQMLQRRSAETAAFWKALLAGHDRISLPLARKTGDPAGERVRTFFDLGEELSGKIDFLAAREKTPKRDLFLTAFALLLRYLTNVDDISFGLVANCRPAIEDGDRILGCFLNTVPFRQTISSNSAPRKLLSESSTRAAEIKNHERLPLREIARAAGLSDTHSQAIFEILFNYADFHVYDAIKGDVQTVAPLVAGHESTNTAFDFGITRRGPTFLVTLSAGKNSYSEDDLQRILSYYRRILLAFVDDFDTALTYRHVLPDAEIHSLLNVFNATSARYPEQKSIADLFEEQAARTPDRTAIWFKESAISYARLNAQANAIAASLRTRGVRAGDLVGVLMERTPDTIAAFIAILKVGAAYVPADPAYPEERIRFMLSDSGCKIVVSASDLSELAARCSDPASTEILNIDDVRVDAGKRPGNPARLPDADRAAYVIYTSGSTGKPKGCIVTNRNVVRLMKNDKHPFDFTENDVWIIAHSYCFDFSVWEMYGALLYGGSTVVVSRDEVRDTLTFLSLLRKYRVSVLNQTPAGFYNLIEAESASPVKDLSGHLRYVVFGGDRLELTYLKRWVEWYPPTQCKLINMFGITETTVHVTFGELTSADINSGDGTSPIGTPLPETTVYICDNHLQLLPTGVAGEMFVGGTGVSRGYLNRPELTAQRFIDNPFGPGRLYRSGDLGRWRANGTLEYLGRGDDQVQIRGFRVEPGEIESRILKHPGVGKAVVIARESGSGALELIAYLAGAEGVSDAELRKHLTATLPEYMVPAYFVRLPSIPLTSNGKVDRKALPQPVTQVTLRDPCASTPPGTQCQQKIADIWRTVLGGMEFGIRDNFFELGGDSMKVLRVYSGLKPQYPALKIGDLYSAGTIESLAVLLSGPDENSTKQEIGEFVL